MPVITGGAVDPPGSSIAPGTRPTIYYTNGVPTDAGVSNTFTPANGTLAIDVATGNVYERAAAVWTRRDTL